MKELDRMDGKILALLQADNRISNVQLADRVGLSPAACLRRVQRLNDQGVIIANIAVAAPEKLGYLLTAIIDVKLITARYDVISRFKSGILKRREVLQCYLVTGDTDFVLIVQVPDIHAFECFLEEALYNSPAVEKVRSQLVVNRLKFCLSLETDWV